MSSCGTGGQFVISVQCLLKSQGFDCDSLFLLKKVFGALAANLGSGSTDGGLSSIAVVLCTVVTGTTFTLSCFWWAVSRVVFSAALVWCCALAPRDGGRSPATAEPVSVCVGHVQNGGSGVRRRNRALSSPTDSEDSFDSGHAQHTGKMCDSPNALFWILTPGGDV